MSRLPLLFLILLASQAIGQNGRLSVKQIDSLASIIDSTKGRPTAISDGSIQPKGKRRPKGGFSDTYFLQKDTAKLLEVENGQSLFTNDFTTYYFHNDSLILVRTTIRDIKDGHEITSGRYYFDNGILLMKQEEGKPVSRPEIYRQDARRYLKDVKGLFNRSFH